jgi:hypothetical protein
MVFLLNEAIDYAQKGDYTKVSSLVNQIISLESEVSKLGVENKNKQLIFSAIAVSVVFRKCWLLSLYMDLECL